MNERFQRMLKWLENQPLLQGCEVSEPVPASSDASFRRYFRIQVDSPNAETTSYIIMDAPPEHEDCRPFIEVSNQLVRMGLQVPEVLAQDLQQGFLLLTDLGSTTYLSVLTSASESEADSLYQDALTALVTLQKQGHKSAEALPPYDAKLLDTEMNLFSDWLLATHLEMPLGKLDSQNWAEVKDVLQKSALKQPKTYVHRDYHSRNLMVTPEHNPGILDFQDAVHGPLTYDAVSLLRDCYIAWPAEQVVEWQRSYFLQLCEANLLSKDEWNGFRESMDLMGIQRHLKASGIFARLYHRDGKDGYLNDIPLTLDYIVKVGAQYPQLKTLVALVETQMLPHAMLQKSIA
ncbi:phosphotransferase [Thiomicrorhabdus sp. ZW0627]|uniref:aminoglycoside phosphotransferase family protein n=1 Tax=Thiomicrorhabdus sp. ZW0627 TaxID=3039774 RepID=UPI0024373959|nr:phosphotransferase [Thiomicrorhabdus sp. ZW0627]MDG6773517.1 phosphotransferase [Thiomicrorhabdus sp. ZW0627]